MKRLSENNGFTLIELIVVMAIIAILVLLAAPSFLGYTKDAKVTAMKQDTKVLSNAAELYHIENESWPATNKLAEHNIGGVDKLYILEHTALDDSVKNIEGDYDDYGISISGESEGEIYHLSGIDDKNGVSHFNYMLSGANAPGPQKLVGGDMDAGFFGEVSTDELVDGLEIAEMVELSAGIPQFTNEPWLKFASEGKIIFKSKKTYRNGANWHDLDKLGLVFGEKEVVIDNNKYKVRLLKGSTLEEADTSNSYDSFNSEWNKLMLPIHEKSVNGNWKMNNKENSKVESWGINYTDRDLHTFHKNNAGTAHWVQTARKGTEEKYHMYRGWYDVSYAYFDYAKSNYNNYGWSPVLEFVGHVKNTEEHMK